VQVLGGCNERRQQQRQQQMQQIVAGLQAVVLLVLMVQSVQLSSSSSSSSRQGVGRGPVQPLVLQQLLRLLLLLVPGHVVRLVAGESYVATSPTYIVRTDV
jgi:hypothetical protein